MKHPQPHDLTALAFDLIEGPERVGLLEHMAACDACREEYDRLREEQVVLRDVMLEDARGGAAEARALERVLSALGDEATVAEEARGKVIPLREDGSSAFSRRWFVIFGNVAAALAVALVLLFGVLPANDEGVEDGGGSTAGGDKTPAVAGVETPRVVWVSSGPEGWEDPSGLNFDEWTSTGAREPMTLNFVDGPSFEIRGGTEFKLSREGFAQTPVVVMRGGSAAVNTASVEIPARVVAGEANTIQFFVLPGGYAEVNCIMATTRTDEPESVDASVRTGNVILARRMGDDLRAGLLADGEKVQLAGLRMQRQNHVGDWEEFSSLFGEAEQDSARIAVALSWVAQNKRLVDDEDLKRAIEEIQEALNSAQNELHQQGSRLEALKVQATGSRSSVSISINGLTLTVSIVDDERAVAEMGKTGGETTTFELTVPPELDHPEAQEYRGVLDRPEGLENLRKEHPEFAEFIDRVRIVRTSGGGLKVMLYDDDSQKSPNAPPSQD